MNKIEEMTTIRRNANLLVSEMDGELVMLSVEHGNYYGLSAVGKRIWEHLEQPRTFHELCELLQAEFDVTSETCREEVHTFVQQLADEKMVELLP